LLTGISHRGRRLVSWFPDGRERTEASRRTDQFNPRTNSASTSFTAGNRALSGAVLRMMDVIRSLPHSNVAMPAIPLMPPVMPPKMPVRPPRLILAARRLGLSA
jgi:hypothetical protein